MSEFKSSLKQLVFQSNILYYIIMTFQALSVFCVQDWKAGPMACVVIWYWQASKKDSVHTSLVPRTSHVFQCMQEKSRRHQYWSGDVTRCSLRRGCISLPTCPRSSPCGQSNDHAHCMGTEWVKIHNHMSNHVWLHHQINQAVLVFLAYVENMGRPGFKANAYM